MSKQKIKIICIGNRFRSDDAIGLVIADELSKLKLKNASIIESEGEGLDLINQLSDGKKIIIIDAVKSNSEPGTIHVFNPLENEIPEDKFNLTSHFFNLAQAFELAKTLNSQGYLDIIPKEIKFIGIEGKYFGVGEQISKEVLDSVKKVIEIITNTLTEKG